MGNIAIVTILSLPTPSTNELPFIYLGLLPFLSAILRCVYSMSFASLLVNVFLCIVFLIGCKWNWFLNFILFVHCYCIGSSMDFCVLILCPAAPRNGYTTFNTFLVDSLRFSKYNMRSRANRASFTPSFPIWVCLISFSCLIARFSPPVPCSVGMVRADILVLFSILGGREPVFHC